ncbi:hypothetical protein RB614_27805 [Phytohabitans sp. ZYX-F-186]|uniref:Uncharacterized protein n=1 Tax=Phytohabitans maris TaxID=3071409 RepID=A0ABU0ZMS0_9ACTN|nr:hypothetical protein [Phytohabitans sp. ZYX-F-186]MDQ7908338.1 hypothetical protein [Phytohabitans sp. ZYX-F-186]
MLAPTAMIMADKATKQHVLSARPAARTTPERPPRRRNGAMRRLTVRALRRLADRLEPGPAASVPRTT